MSKSFAETLWDLLGLRPQARQSPPGPKRAKPQAAMRAASRPDRQPMQAKYDAVVVEMKSAYSINIRKWRKGSSGVAYEIRYRNGAVKKFIEAPYPRGPMSAAVFLHEVGHHAIGLGIHRPRCLEEYHVWMWALNMMKAKGLNVTPAVEKRVERSMQYAVGKARRRGIRKVPAELMRYT